MMMPAKARIVAFPFSVLLAILSLFAPLASQARVPPRNLDAFLARGVSLARADWLEEGNRREVWVASGPDGEYSRVAVRLVGTTPRFRVWMQADADLPAAPAVAAVNAAESALGRGWLAILERGAREAAPDLYPVEVVYVELEAMGGYFSAADQPGAYSHPYSNRANAVYVGLASCNDRTGCSAPLVAHELQHLLQSQVDPQERTWANEGLSEAAEQILQARPEPVQPIQCSDLPLLEWADEGDAVGLHYAASRSFMSFWRDTYGEAALGRAGSSPVEGSVGLGLSLLLSRGESFNTAFARWSAEQYRLWQEMGADAGLCRWTDAPSPSLHNISAAASLSDTVSQYGCDYVLLDEPGPVVVRFAGATEAWPAAVAADGGYWWSNRFTNSATTLTRELDLSAVGAAHLQFRIWQDIEEGYDWGYVAVSDDGGATWSLLAAEGTTSENVFGNNPGVGYTGPADGWQSRSVDLSPYAGRRVRLQFGYLTDDAHERPGFALDDISVPEIGWRDSADAPEGWTSVGFVLVRGPLRQRFSLRLATTGASTWEVEDLALSARNQGSWLIPPAPDGGRRAILVCGLTEGAAEPAPYDLTVRTRG